MAHRLLNIILLVSSACFASESFASACGRLIWDAEEVLLGSSAIIAVGDRLLVYSNSNDAVISGCTASGVVESQLDGINERNAATLQRMRAWSRH